MPEKRLTTRTIGEPMLIHSIQLTNFLSFGEASEAVQLRDLNVVIGLNGSGKSNLLEAFELLSGAPKDLTKPIRDGGGIRDWLWKDSKTPAVASLEAIVRYPKGPQPLRYRLSFTEVGQRFEIVDEIIEDERAQADKSEADFHYKFQNGHAVLNVQDVKRRLNHEDIDPSQSILSQRRDPDQYPEITYLGQSLSKNSSLPRMELWALHRASTTPEGRPTQRHVGRRLQQSWAGVESIAS